MSEKAQRALMSPKRAMDDLVDDSNRPFVSIEPRKARKTLFTEHQLEAQLEKRESLDVEL